MSVSWIAPKVGDIVLLTRGFENVGQYKGPHYGIVAGIFKITGNHITWLMIAPGTSVKPGRNFDQNTELIIDATSGILGRPTKFFFQ